MIYLVYLVNTMATDGLAAQGARASVTMILTKLNRDNSVAARYKSITIYLVITVCFCISGSIEVHAD